MGWNKGGSHSLFHEQEYRIVANARDEARRVVQEVRNTVKDIYAGAVPDEVAMSIRDYLIAYAHAHHQRVARALLQRARDVRDAERYTDARARAAVTVIIRDIEITFGPDVLRQKIRTLGEPLSRRLVPPTDYEYDVFLSHASEDKLEFVAPLEEALRFRGLKVWYDQAVLMIGDRLAEKIADGLQRSRFGVVVLSPHFFAKNWPAIELNALAAAEASLGRKMLLPVWHNVSRDQVARHSILLSAVLGASSSKGVADVADQIVKAVRRDRQ